jgi:membrane protein implicated in regulation of membrane protease activity
MSAQTLHDIFLALATIALVKLGFLLLMVAAAAIHVANPYVDLAIDLVPFVYLLVLVVGSFIHWRAGERRYRQSNRKEVR